MVFFIDSKPGGIIEAFQECGFEIGFGKFAQLPQRERETVGAIIAVKRTAKFWQLAQQANGWACEFKNEGGLRALGDGDGCGSRRA